MLDLFEFPDDDGSLYRNVAIWTDHVITLELSSVWCVLMDTIIQIT